MSKPVSDLEFTARQCDGLAKELRSVKELDPITTQQIASNVLMLRNLLANAPLLR